MFYEICTIVFLILIALGVLQLCTIKQILYSLTKNTKTIGEKYFKNK